MADRWRLFHLDVICEKIEIKKTLDEIIII